jgi:hypothetical protein
VVVGWIVLSACGPQVALPSSDDESTTVADTGHVGGSAASSTGVTTTTSTGTSTTTSTTSTDVTTGVDPDPSTTTEIHGDASSSEGNGCAPTDECIDDEDCELGGACIACICIGGCTPDGPGQLAACALPDGTQDSSVCEVDAAVCLVDTTEMPAYGVCTMPCESVCDCPTVPGYEAQIACDNITGGDDTTECVLACGSRCPPAMVCVQGSVCMWPT